MFLASAVIIGVFMSISVLLLLELIFCGNETSTLTTSNHTGEREGLILESWLIGIADYFQYFLVFFESYYGLMISLIELVLEIEVPSIEDVSEHTMESTYGELTICLIFPEKSKCIFLIGKFDYFCHSVASSEYQHKELS